MEWMKRPQPSTFNPKPETRNPQLSTRNPKPETRNPKPETLVTRTPHPSRLVQIMDKTVGAMYLSEEAKKMIRLDLGQVVRFKTSVDQRLSLLQSLLRDLPSLT
jgi:hypothetical protein